MSFLTGRSLTGSPRILWLTGALLFVTMLVHVAAIGVTRGAINGPVSLRKPATFAESGWLIAWSIALILPTLRTRAWQRHVIGTATLAFVVGETAIIGFQAWRGVPSHYNFSTPLDAALMRGGAAGTAAIFLIGVVVLLIASLRSSGASASVTLGVRSGIAVLLAGCAIGFVMVSNNSGVYQGQFGAGFRQRINAYLGPSPETVGPQYLGFHPATQGGDLVLLHAIGIHGLVLLAVPSLLMSHTALSPKRQLRVTSAAVASISTTMAVLLAQALLVLPLNQLHPLALVALAICAATLLTAYARVAKSLFTRRQERWASESLLA